MVWLLASERWNAASLILLSFVYHFITLPFCVTLSPSAFRSNCFTKGFTVIKLMCLHVDLMLSNQKYDENVNNPLVRFCWGYNEWWWWWW